jgi:hypothetical protein
MPWEHARVSPSPVIVNVTDDLRPIVNSSDDLVPPCDDRREIVLCPDDRAGRLSTLSGANGSREPGPAGRNAPRSDDRSNLKSQFVTSSLRTPRRSVGT